MHLPCEVKGWKLGDGGSRINGAASMSSSGDGYEIRVTEWNLEKEKFSYPMMLLLGVVLHLHLHLLVTMATVATHTKKTIPPR